MLDITSGTHGLARSACAHATVQVGVLGSELVTPLAVSLSLATAPSVFRRSHGLKMRRVLTRTMLACRASGALSACSGCVVADVVNLMPVRDRAVGELICGDVRVLRRGVRHGEQSVIGFSSECQPRPACVRASGHVYALPETLLQRRWRPRRSRVSECALVVHPAEGVRVRRVVTSFDTAGVALVPVVPNGCIERLAGAVSLVVSQAHPELLSRSVTSVNGAFLGGHEATVTYERIGVTQ